jgi:Thaumatin family
MGASIRISRRAVLALACAAACGHPAAAPSDAARGDATAPDATPPPDATPLPPQTARLRVVSRCAASIWIAHSDNVAGDQDVELDDGDYHDYDIPAGGVASTRFWPKLGCDATGHACAVGDNGEGGGAPCPAGGCEPPFDSKFEATFAATGSADATWYDLSLVDGFTLPLTVTPLGAGAGAGTCTVSDCSTLTLDACPDHDDLGGGTYPAYADVDLRVSDPGGAAIACLSPCKRWNYPAPYGFGQAEADDPGLHMCCPTPIDPQSGNCTVANGCMTPDACRNAIDPMSVVHTAYVAAVHARCPSAYSYAYDDGAGLHDCPADTRFVVVFCP